jgi:hypothetical protein
MMTQVTPPPEDAGADNLEPIPAKNGAPRPFTVTELEKTDAPDGGTGHDWYRYVLHNGKATVTGQRQGTREHVATYAAQFAEQLNARGFRGQSVWSPRGTKPGVPGA